MNYETRWGRKKFKNFVPTTPEEIKYYEAAEKVKKIKGFYNHLAVYVVVNIMIFILNVRDLDPGESYFELRNFSTAFFWGIGLLAHGCSVFLPGMILGEKWEERKIREFMEKEKQNKWE